MKIEAPLGPRALHILRQTPGVSAHLPDWGDERQADAVLHFAGTRARAVVETKRRVNAATAWQIVRTDTERPDVPTLLIADETTAEAREILGRHNIGVIDGLGNAQVELPGLLLQREGRSGSRGLGPSPTRLSAKAGLVAQALLLQPERAWRVKDLIEVAGVSAGLAHRVVVRLEREGVVGATGNGPRRTRQVTDPSALLDLWAEESVERPSRTQGFLLAQTPQGLVTKLGANLGESGIDYAITGAAAASLIAPFLTAVPVAEVWVSAKAGSEELLVGAGAEGAEGGENVVFLQAKDDAPLAFREQKKGVRVANRFRLYADLLRDPRRGREQAEHLRREVIGF